MLGQAAAGDPGLSALAGCCSPGWLAGWLPSRWPPPGHSPAEPIPAAAAGAERTLAHSQRTANAASAQQHSSGVVYIAQFCDYLYDAVARWRSVHKADERAVDHRVAVTRGDAEVDARPNGAAMNGAVPDRSLRGALSPPGWSGYLAGPGHSRGMSSGRHSVHGRVAAVDVPCLRSGGVGTAVVVTAVRPSRNPGAHHGRAQVRPYVPVSSTGVSCRRCARAWPTLLGWGGGRVTVSSRIGG
jgi:hypothetical protein